MNRLFIKSPDFKDQSDATVNSESVQLISKSQNGDLVVNDEALEIIKNINGKVAAFIVVGPYRQGKSYILNRLLDSSCFKVGHTDNSCTKGLWMSKNVLKQQNILKDEVNVIYLDTEGIESDDSNSEWDTKIFLSSLLISSMFCYNTKNALTSDAIKKLSVMSILSERVKLNSTEAIIDRSECPDFLWVVRDYSLRSTLTPIERLNKFLEEESTQSVGNSNVLNSIIERNKIRTRLKSAFFQMDCKYLPCPVTDGTNNMSLEEALQNMDDIKWEDLREPFRKGMTELCKLIKERIRPKIINKTNVNGRIFAAYIKEIVNKLNLNQTICLTESLIASIKLAAFEALEIVQPKYKNEMNRLVYPLDWDKFSYTEAQNNDKCVRELKENIIGDNQILNQTLEKFSNFKQTLNEQLKEKNGKAIFEKAYNLANTIWTTKMNPKIASFKYSYEFNQFIQTLKIEFETNEFKSSKESKEAWIKLIESKNTANIETSIENKRINEEKINALEAEKEVQRKKAVEEANKRAEVEKRNRELEMSSSRSSYSSYSSYQQPCPSPITTWLASGINNTRFSDTSSVSSASSSTGPRCNDGSLDMRYKANKGFDKYND